MTMFTWKRQIRTYKVAEEWGTNSLLMFWLGVGKILRIFIFLIGGTGVSMSFESYSEFEYARMVYLKIRSIKSLRKGRSGS